MPSAFRAPLEGSIAYEEIVSDFPPETTMKRPLGSIWKPRGYFSVAELEIRELAAGGVDAEAADAAAGASG